MDIPNVIIGIDPYPNVYPEASPCFLVSGKMLINHKTEFGPIELG